MAYNGGNKRHISSWRQAGEEKKNNQHGVNVMTNSGS